MNGFSLKLENEQLQINETTNKVSSKEII